MNTDFYKSDIDNSIINEDEGEMDYPVHPPLHRIILGIPLSPTFRIPKFVTKVRIYKDRSDFAVCPRCNHSIEYEYQLYCGHCGQHLLWSKFSNVTEEEFIGWNGIEPEDDEDEEDNGDSDY